MKHCFYFVRRYTPLNPIFVKLKKSTKIIAGVVTGLLIIGIIATPDPEKTKPETTVKESATLADNSVAPVSAPTEKVLFSSTDAFKDAFNNFCRKSNFDYSINDITVGEGEVQNTFQIMLNTNVGFIGAVNKSTGSVKEITMIGSGDGSANSGIDIMQGMACVIGSADPSLAPGERGEILTALGILDKTKNIYNLQASKDVNGVHYWINSSELTGIMFGASVK
jgi:hypothetical protein